MQRRTYWLCFLIVAIATQLLLGRGVYASTSASDTTLKKNIEQAVCGISSNSAFVIAEGKTPENGKSNTWTKLHSELLFAGCANTLSLTTANRHQLELEPITRKLWLWHRALLT